MDLFEWVVFLISFGAVLGAVVFTARHYISYNSRFEDYYFLLTVLNVLAYYICCFIVAFTGKAMLNVVLIGQCHLLWAYWFLSIYLFKLSPVHSIRARRIVYMALSCLIVFGSIHAIASDQPRYLQQGIIAEGQSILMYMDYAIDQDFSYSLQIIKLLVIASGIVFAWRVENRPSWVFFAMTFLFMEELLTTINIVIIKPHPNELIFSWVQILIVFTNIFIVIGVRQYFKKRIR